MIKISVIIPTYNSWLTLKLCITSIEKQTIKPFEIIVIDNGSSDNTIVGIKKFFPKIKLIKLKDNSGVSGGRNAGIKRASREADFLFFLDHDMIADKNMLQQLAEVAEMDKYIGIVTPKIYYWENKQRIWAAGTDINLWTGQVLFRGGVDIGQYDSVAEVQVAPAAMLVKREVVDKVVKFDERYFATYEDTDFCFRARKAGFKTFYTPKAIAYHMIPSDPREESVRLLSRTYWVGRNRVIFMKDFGKNFIVFLFFVPIFSIYYLKLAIKYRRIRSWFEFIKGTAKGVFV